MASRPALAAALALLLAPGADAQVVRVKLAAKPHPVVMGVEDYVAAALAGEAGGFRSMEALKAMAVAARTFMRVNLGRHARQGFDLCETTHCQDLRVKSVTPRLRKAAAETESVLLWYDGRPARIYYTEHCGGQTENAASVWRGAARPYLRGVKDDFCLSAGRGTWKAEYALEALAAAFGAPAAHDLEIASRTRTGRVAILRLGGRQIDAERFYLTVGRTFGWDQLRSKLFSMKILDGSTAVFEGWGRGHGVGLCQTGAEQRGLAGHDFKQILAAYFPGTTTGIAGAGIHWLVHRGRAVDVKVTGQPGDDAAADTAEWAFQEAENRLKLKAAGRVEVRVYPSIEVFRDVTGEPGLVAAATRGNVIHLQPAARLVSQGRLRSVLLHEMIHAVAVTPPGIPRWFHEGLALEIENPGKEAPAALKPSTEAILLRPSTEAQLRAAYRNAQAAVAKLMKERGREAVIAYARNGLPAGMK